MFHRRLVSNLVCASAAIALSFFFVQCASTHALLHVSEINERPASALAVGDMALDFEIASEGPAGKPLSLSDYLGKEAVLLAFYPKVFTGGCTKQLCGYRDEYSLFQDAGVQVVAISIDEQQESNRFKQEYNMPFHVVGDPEQSIVNAYGVSVGVWKGMPIAKRSVFLIDKSGRISYVDPDYRIIKDKDALYGAIGKLSQ